MLDSGFICDLVSCCRRQPAELGVRGEVGPALGRLRRGAWRPHPTGGAGALAPAAVPRGRTRVGTGGLTGAMQQLSFAISHFHCICPAAISFPSQPLLSLHRRFPLSSVQCLEYDSDIVYKHPHNLSQRCQPALCSPSTVFTVQGVSLFTGMR